MKAAREVPYPEGAVFARKAWSDLGKIGCIEYRCEPYAPEQGGEDEPGSEEEGEDTLGQIVGRAVAVLSVVHVKGVDVGLRKPRYHHCCNAKVDHLVPDRGDLIANMHIVRRWPVSIVH